MKRIFPLFISLLYCFHATGQSREMTGHIRDAGRFTKNFIEKNNYPGEKIPFSKIIVYDNRYDSSKLGYIDKDAPRSSFSSIHSKHDWETTLNSYFRDILDPSANCVLVLAIRTFWLQEGLFDETLNKKIIKKDAFGNSDPGGFCRAAIDVYIQTDSLVPYFRLDDVFLEFYKFKGAGLEKFYFLPFDSIARKIRKSDPGIIKRTRKLSFAEVANFYQKRNNLPILADTATRKGVFKTFEDFKNNRPLEEKFIIRRSKLTDELYLVDGKQETLLLDFWGARDEKDLYIKVGYSICIAVRIQNTFEVLGAKHVSHYHNNPQPGQLIRMNYMSLNRKILQLDMDTGSFY